MGIGTITLDAPRVAANLRSWTGQVADAARLHGMPRGSHPFRPASDVAASLATVDEALVRTIGWEMRDAVDWRPDGYCVQRANLTVLAAAQRLLGGDLGAAYANGAARDGRLGAQLVAFAPLRPGFGYEARFHSAAVFRTPDADLVVDHLATDAADGVLHVDDWLRAVAPRVREDVALVAASHRPPFSAKVGSGIPVGATWMRPEDWSRTGRELAAALERGAPMSGSAAARR